MTNAELLNTNSRDQKKSKNKQNVQMRQKLAKIHKKKIEYLQNLCGNSGKTQNAKVQDRNANFYTNLNQKKIQQMNLRN